MRRTKFHLTAGALVSAVAITAVLALSGCKTTGSPGMASTESPQYSPYDNPTTIPSSQYSPSPQSAPPTGSSGIGSSASAHVPSPPGSSGIGSSASAQAAPLAAIPTIPGPKRTVSVGKFDAIGAFTARYGNWDIGGGLSAMLTSALVRSGRFIVVERANLGQVLKEQIFAGKKMTRGGPKLGQLTGVQMVIYGSVTEFGVDEEGGSFGIGFAGMGGLLSSALGMETSSGSVAMDIRLVDTTTGQVLETHQVKEPLESTQVNLDFGYKGISMGGDKFWNTPLGEACRRAINRVVYAVAVRAAKTPWTGRVVDFDGQEMFINAGAGSGLRAGDQFMIERVAKKLTDPETGELLSVRKAEIGMLRLTGVENKVAYGTYTPIAATPPQRGDLVLMMRR